TVWFEYGPAESLGTLTEKKSVGSGREWQDVTLEANLAPGVEYYYRLVVNSSLGTARGDILRMRAAGNSTLVLEPRAATLKIGEVVKFKALYDPDGDGAEPSRDVTGQAMWISSNTIVLFSERSGEFRARGAGEVIVSATYNPKGRVVNVYDPENLKAAGSVTVDEDSAVPDVELEPSPDNSSSGLTWLIAKWIFLILLIGGILAAIFIFVRRRMQQHDN
ncbi:MAG: hypothetical protein AAB867_01330, partial [Patescibacteria group bacterium]